MALREPEVSVFRSSVWRPRRGQPANGARLLIGSILERSLLMFAVMIFCGISDFGRQPVAGSPDSNPVNLYSNIIILMSFGLLIIVNARTTLPLLARSHLLLMFVGLALLSFIWSIEPSITIRRMGPLATTIMVALYMAACLDFSKSLRIIGHALLTVVVLSLLVAVVWPDIGVTKGAINHVDELAGTWKGILANKNALGWITIAGIQVYAWRFLVEPERRLRHAVAAGLFVFAMYKSQSATALIGVTLSIAMTAVLQARKRQSISRVSLEWATLGLVVIGIGALLVDPGGIFGLLGKDASLTGRVPLWGDLIGSIARHPLLGYGYGAFWLNSNPEMIRVWMLNPWQPPDAHDAYLEMALGLGIVGTILATSIVLVLTVRAVSLCKQPQARWAVYVATFLIVFIVTNLDETQMFRGGDVDCFLLSLCYFVVLRHRHGHDVDPKGDRFRQEENRVATVQPALPAKGFLADTRPTAFLQSADVDGKRETASTIFHSLEK